MPLMAHANPKKVIIAAATQVQGSPAMIAFAAPDLVEINSLRCADRLAFISTLRGPCGIRDGAGCSAVAGNQSAC